MTDWEGAHGGIFKDPLRFLKFGKDSLCAFILLVYQMFQTNKHKKQEKPFRVYQTTLPLWDPIFIIWDYKYGPVMDTMLSSAYLAILQTHCVAK